MEILSRYTAVREELFTYFGYVENWRVLPVDDATDYYWLLEQDESGHGSVIFAEDKDCLCTGIGDYYKNEIYTQRFLPKWVYRGADYTMICVDTHVDGNKFLQIFTNAKEIKP